MEREEVYRVLDGERDYQDSKWPGEAHANHEVESWILYMDVYLNKAKQAITDNSGVDDALAKLRKVTALG